MAHRHNAYHDPHLPQLGNAATAGPAMIVGTGLMIAIPIFTLINDWMFPPGPSKPTATGDFFEYYKPIDATPDKLATLPLYGLQSSPNTSPTVAFMDAIDAFKKKQEQAKRAADLQVLFKDHELKVHRVQTLKAALEAAINFKVQHITCNVGYQPGAWEMQRSRFQDWIQHEYEIRAAASANNKEQSRVGRSRYRDFINFAKVYCCTIIFLFPLNQTRSGKVLFIQIASFGVDLMHGVSARFKRVSDLLKYLCTAMVIRKEPDMNKLAIVALKGMLKDPAFLSMIMQEPTLELLIEQKTKHFYERESAQFKAKVIDVLFKKNQDLGVSINNIGLSIRDMKKEHAGFRIVNKAAVAISNDEVKNITGPLLKRVTTLESQLCEQENNNTEIVNLAIATFKKDYVEGLESKMNAFITQMTAAHKLNNTRIAGAIKTAILDFKADFFDADHEKVNELKAIADSNNAEDVDLVKRLFMITYQDHATSVRCLKATEGRKGTDRLHAVTTAHIETLAIILAELKRKIDPPDPKHGQPSLMPSSTNNWGLPQPSLLPNGAADPTGWPNNLFTPGDPNFSGLMVPPNGPDGRPVPFRERFPMDPNAK